MTETPSSPSDAPRATAEQRVSMLVGDRLCIRCHYNLSGQPVLREGHYNMLIVRCPECATVASLQEHPLLGRWASRWAVVLVGLWLIVLLAVWSITTAILYGMTNEAGMKATEPFAVHLSELQKVWIEASGVEDDQQFWRFARGRYHTRLHDDWWKEQDPKALLAEVGGWTRIADWRAAWSIVQWSPLLIAIGGVWSLLLPHVRRRWLPACSLALIALPMLFVLMGNVDALGTAWTWSIGDTAFPLVGMKVQIAALLAIALPLSLGLLIGRTMARLAVLAILPPRLRSSLGGLWLIDSLPPPVGARVTR